MLTQVNPLSLEHVSLTLEKRGAPGVHVDINLVGGCEPMCGPSPQVKLKMSNRGWGDVRLPCSFPERNKSN
jgi:hypothetical protein